MKFTFLKIIVLCFAIFCSNNIFGQDDDFADKKSYLTKVQISEPDKIKVFNNLWDTVNRLYFDPTFNNHDWAKLREIYLPQAVAAPDKIALVNVLNQMLGELKTSHLVVSFEIGINGGTLKKFFGGNIDYKQNDIIYDYGFSTTNFGNQPVVISVDKTSGADEAGIKIGWIMKSCQDKVLSEKQDDALIHSETSNCVFLLENNQEKSVLINKSFYLKPNSSALRNSKLLSENILYVKFDSFDKGTGKWLKKQIVENSAAKSLIIDLRGNVGGYFNELEDALSLFFPTKTVIGNSIERDLDNKILRVGANDFFKVNVVVLIDEKSFSAAEIFASAFQEFGRGQIIGQKSSGYVLGGVTKNLSNNLKLYVAVRDYKTSKGLRLEGIGITPDVEIPLTVEDFRNQHDVTLEKALEFLTN